jgi:hypothetical protein
MSKAEVNYIATGSGNLSIMVFDSAGTMANYVIDLTHINHRKIVDLLKAQAKSGRAWTDEKIRELALLCNIGESVNKAKETFVAEAASSKSSLVGTAEVRDGQVFVNNVPVHNVISDRIVALVQQGFSVLPILRFLELILENPSSRAQLELYDFLANRALPLTEDGHFLAYKRVDENWKDLHTGTIDNSVGNTVSIPREAVDDNRDRQCSYGLHVGALEYVRGFGRNGHVVIVKVNPRDCIAVPLDHNAQKLRVCSYKVLYEHDETKFLERPVYSTDGTTKNIGSFVDEADVEEDDRHWEHGWDEDEWPDDDWNREEDEDWNDEEECGDDCSVCGSVDVSAVPGKDNYDDWRLDNLANEAKSRGYTSSRQEGRDLGRAQLIRMLRSNR